MVSYEIKTFLPVKCTGYKHSYEQPCSLGLRLFHFRLISWGPNVPENSSFECFLLFPPSEKLYFVGLARIFVFNLFFARKNILFSNTLLLSKRVYLYFALQETC